jgi:macrolide transport system ATP-binding/permease protein
MKRLRSLLLRTAGIFPRQRREQNLAAEIDSHLQMHIDDNLRSGMAPAQARREAILKLGGIEMTKQAYREQTTLPFLETLLQDLRFALRQSRRSPGFSCTAILILALGLAASVAIFAFVDAALIKPLPYQDPARLVEVTESVKMFPRANFSYQDYVDWKRVNHVFSSVEVYTGTGYLLSLPSGSEPVPATRVSDGFFRILGIKPVLGRDFYSGEDQPGAANTVIIPYTTWQRRYGGRQDVIGQKVVLSGVPNTIIGVLPQEFQFGPRGAAEFWATLHELNSCEKRRSCHNLTGIGRLKDGVTVQSALANTQAIAKQLEIQYPGSNRGQGASVLPLSEAIVGDVRPILLVLLAGAGLLLLIACVNVCSLLLVRAESRRREVAVRGALGASPARLVRQFITEGILLVATGSIVGLALASAAMHILLELLSKDMLIRMPYLRGLGLNLHVLLFAGVISMLAAALFSLAPVVRLPLHAMRDGLTEGSRGAAGTLWRRFGANLVVVELATAVVLLVGAGLLGKSFYRLLRVDLGFQPDHLAALQVAVPDLAYPKDEQNVALARQIVSRTSALPGVLSAAIASRLPVSGNGNTDWIRFVGRPYDGQHNEVNSREVSSGYFTTLQARLLRGRYFTDDEEQSKPHVAVISQSLAQLYFPGEDPLGKTFGDTELTPKSIRQIIGVVEDIREGALDAKTWPTEYVPFNQGPDTYYNLIVRTSQAEQTVLPTLSAAIHQIDPGIGTTGETTLTATINDSQTAYLHRSSAWLVGGFAALALLLGVVGLYGVIAYSVSQRTREIGVRMALGAQRSSVYQLILREAGWLTSLGMTAGLLCSVLAASLMRNLLFGTEAWDLQTLAGVAFLLTLSALLASYIPARRAASVNPVEALRAE